MVFSAVFQKALLILSLDVSIGIRTDEDSFSTGSKLDR